MNREPIALSLARFVCISLCFAILTAAYEPFELILTIAVLFGFLFLGILMIAMAIFDITKRLPKLYNDLKQAFNNLWPQNN